MASPRRVLEALVILVLLGAASASSAAASAMAASDRAGTRDQQLAAVSHDTRVFALPSRSSRRVGELRDYGPITGKQAVVPVIARATGPRGGHWLKVLLPGRPNGHSGWISRAATTRSVTPWQISVKLSTMQIIVRY
jgi:hypothetical protein